MGSSFRIAAWSEAPPPRSGTRIRPASVGRSAGLSGRRDCTADVSYTGAPPFATNVPPGDTDHGTTRRLPHSRDRRHRPRPLLRHGAFGPGRGSRAHRPAGICRPGLEVRCPEPGPALAGRGPEAPRGGRSRPRHGGAGRRTDRGLPARSHGAARSRPGRVPGAEPEARLRAA